MKWPSALAIRVLSARTGVPFAGLILFLEIPARRKNSYTLGPVQTAVNGEVRIKRRDVEQVIERSMADFPMDYASTLPECLERAVVVIEDRAALERRVARLAVFFPQQAAALSELLRHSSNDAVVPLRLEIDPQTSPVELII